MTPREAVDAMTAAAARALAGSVGAPPAVDEQAVRAAIQGALTDAGAPVAVGAVEVDVDAGVVRWRVDGPMSDEDEAALRRMLGSG